MLLALISIFGLGTPTALDAERALHRDAQRMGQWTAFRAYAGRDAVMFTPQVVWARDYLRNRKDPATALQWSPNASYVSCDGRIAVNTGPFTSASGNQSGYFTTVWQKEKRRWRWIYDGGDVLQAPIAALKTPVVTKGSCRGRAPGAPLIVAPTTKKGPRGQAPDDYGTGQSADRTLAWDWKVDSKGVRHFRTFLWNGRDYTAALDQVVAPPSGLR